MRNGILYRERYPISFENGIPVIDYSSQVELIYNKDIGLTRQSQDSTIIEMTFGGE